MNQHEKKKGMRQMLFKDFYSVGWDSANQIHSAVKNSTNVSLLENANSDLRRFATTVLHLMDYSNTQTKQMRLQLGQKERADISSIGSKDVDYIHRKFKNEIESHHLEKPDLTNEELSDFLLTEGLKKAPELFDLITNDTNKNITIKL